MTSSATNTTVTTPPQQGIAPQLATAIALAIEQQTAGLTVRGRPPVCKVPRQRQRPSPVDDTEAGQALVSGLPPSAEYTVCVTRKERDWLHAVAARRAVTPAGLIAGVASGKWTLDWEGITPPPPPNVARLAHRFTVRLTSADLRLIRERMTCLSALIAEQHRRTPEPLDLSTYLRDTTLGRQPVPWLNGDPDPRPILRHTDDLLASQRIQQQLWPVWRSWVRSATQPEIAAVATQVAAAQKAMTERVASHGVSSLSEEGSADGQRFHHACHLIRQARLLRLRGTGAMPTVGLWADVMWGLNRLPASPHRQLEVVPATTSAHSLPNEASYAL